MFSGRNDISCFFSYRCSLIFIFLWLIMLYFDFHAFQRFRNELPDTSAQPKLMSLRKEKDQYVFYSFPSKVCIGVQLVLIHEVLLHFLFFSSLYTAPHFARYNYVILTIYNYLTLYKNYPPCDSY